MSQPNPSQRLAEDVAAWGAPVFEELGLSVYDVELSSGRLLVMVDKQGGVALDEIARCTRGLSPILDAHDPIPGRYTLEVSSPGIERRLRTVAHRRAAVGETVKCKFRDRDGAARRVEGMLGDVDDTRVVVETDDGPVTIRHDEVTSLRTVFVWPEPSTTKGKRRTNEGNQSADHDHVREATS